MTKISIYSKEDIDEFDVIDCMADIINKIVDQMYIYYKEHSIDTLITIDKRLDFHYEKIKKCIYITEKIALDTPVNSLIIYISMHDNTLKSGKLLKIFLRTSVDYSSETFTWKLYTRNVSASTGGGPSEIGAQSGAGPTNKTMVTYDFTSSLDSGTNAIVAGDKVQISIEAGDGATANGNYFITCMWEWDLS